jgi:integrase
MEVKKMFKNYLKWCEATKIKPTFVSCNNKVIQISKCLGKIMVGNTRELTKEKCCELVTELKNGRKNSSVNKLLTEFNAALKYNELTLKFDIKALKLKDDNTTYARVRDEEIDSILDFIINGSSVLHHRLALCLLLETGARATELLNIEWNNIDYLNTSIKLTKTKNGNSRLVPFGELSLDLLNQQPKINKYVFWNPKTKNILTYQMLRRTFESLKRMTGLDYSSHNMRKTFATVILERGCNVRDIQRVLGHTSLVMTQLYLMVDDKTAVSHFNLAKPNYKERGSRVVSS